MLKYINYWQLYWCHHAEFLGPISLLGEFTKASESQISETKQNEKKYGVCKIKCVLPVRPSGD